MIEQPCSCGALTLVSLGVQKEELEEAEAQGTSPHFTGPLFSHVTEHNLRFSCSTLSHEACKPQPNSWSGVLTELF